MPKYRITDPDGKAYDVTAPDGASEDEVLAYAQRAFKMAAAPAKRKKGFGEDLSDTLTDIPRQVGLTARYGLEGVGNALDFVSSPIRGALNLLPGMDIKPGSGQVLANAASLPQPQNERERIVGDMTRTVAGAAPIIKAAQGVQALSSGVTKGVAGIMAARPGMQAVSAAAAGGAGGYTRETGGGPGAQLVASLAGGIAAPFAMAGATNLASGVQRAMTPRPVPSPQQIDITINGALRGNGLTLDQMADDVAAGIRADVAKAYQIGDDISPDAVRRLADYRAVGATPNRAGLTLDPAVVTQQRNLAKQGINSKDPVANRLGQTENANNRQLTSGLNLISNTSDDAIAGGSKVIKALEDRNARAQKIIGGLYDKARDSSGRSAPLDPSSFTQRAGNLLNEANVESFLTADIRNKLNGFAKGEIPLTVEIAEQFKTSIGNLQRSSMDGNVRKALGLVRQALDETPLIGAQSAPRGGNQLTVPGGLAGANQPSVGQSAIDAFNKARGMNRSWMKIVEETPALQAVRDGVEPDQFVQKFIIGKGNNSNVMDVSKMKSSIKANPDAMNAVKEQMTAYLKQKALNGAADEVGNFSQSAYNKALESIGERKLRLFFSADEVNQMKAIGRVASYEQFQPKGSAVNNSNTAGALGGMVERLAGSSLLGKIPFGRQIIGDPLENILLSSQSKTALDAPRALTNGVRRPQPAERMGVAVSPFGLLGAETEEDRKKRERGY